MTGDRQFIKENFWKTLNCLGQKKSSKTTPECLR